MVLAHAIIGFINASVFRAIRRLPSSALQEKIAKSLFIPLAIGDITYLLGTFYGIGDVRWTLSDWPRILWLNVIVGIAFFIPRCVGAGMIPNPTNDIDSATGSVGSSVSEDTLRLATAGWTARINIERSSQAVTEDHAPSLAYHNSFQAQNCVYFCLPIEWMSSVALPMFTTLTRSRKIRKVQIRSRKIS